MFLSKLLRAADHPYLEGLGGRKVSFPISTEIQISFQCIQANNNPFTAMQGTTLKSIRHHTALQPLFVIMGAGIVFVALYVGR